MALDWGNSHPICLIARAKLQKSDCYLIDEMLESSVSRQDLVTDDSDSLFLQSVSAWRTGHKTFIIS